MEILWTDFAIKNLKAIFKYYAEKANIKIAHRIRSQILQSTKKLKNNPELGQIEFSLKSFKQNHRYILKDNYKIIYKIKENKIIINDVFDTRQNPLKMNDKSRKTD